MVAVDDRVTYMVDNYPADIVNLGVEILRKSLEAPTPFLSVELVSRYLARARDGKRVLLRWLTRNMIFVCEDFAAQMEMSVEEYFHVIALNSDNPKYVTALAKYALIENYLMLYDYVLYSFNVDYPDMPEQVVFSGVVSEYSRVVRTMATIIEAKLALDSMRDLAKGMSDTDFGKFFA